MRIIGIDYGDARVGIATSDETGFLATANCTVNVTGMRDACKKVTEKIKELGGTKIVLGLPKNMDGSEGFRAEECRAAAKKIADSSGIEVEMWDERCTTVSAHTVLNMNDTRGKKRKGVVDTLSAEIILQNYIDKERFAKENK